MDAARPNGKRFHDEMLKPRPRKRPRLMLSLINVAKDYQARLNAARDCRTLLVAEALRRAPDRATALAMLNYLARDFGLEPFNQREIDRAAAAE